MTFFDEREGSEAFDIHLLDQYIVHGCLCHLREKFFIIGRSVHIMCLAKKNGSWLVRVTLGGAVFLKKLDQGDAEKSVWQIARIIHRPKVFIFVLNTSTTFVRLASAARIRKSIANSARPV